MAVANRFEFSTREELAQQLATDIIAQLDRAIEDRGRGCLAVSGGSTPGLLFKMLSKTRFNWADVDISLVDERDVPATDDRSNEKLVRETLLVDAAKAATFHPLRANDAAKTNYPARFDAMILGLGNDGHTASWFPGGDTLSCATDPMCPKTVMRMVAPGIPEERITYTFPPIAGSNFLALHIEGNEKQKTLNLAEGDGDTHDMPIRHLLRNEDVALNIYWAP